MINSQDIKNGTCIRLDNRLYFCIEFLHVKPGKGNTFMRTKLKDVVDVAYSSAASTSAKSSKTFALNAVLINSFTPKAMTTSS